MTDVQPAASASGDAKGVPLVDTLTDRIRSAIRAGRLVSGQRLVESELCLQFSTSRASLREAFGRLQTEGLIELAHQKGARVRRFTPADIKSLYFAREALEGMAARLAAINIDRYRGRLEEMERSYDNDDDASPVLYFDYNERFHNLLLEMSESPWLAGLVEQLETPAMVFLLPQLRHNRFAVETSREEHRPIVQAVLAGDADGAERAMRRHISNTAERIAAQIAQWDGPIA